jgi:hypothetical protein
MQFILIIVSEDCLSNRAIFPSRKSRVSAKKDEALNQALRLYTL